MLNSNFAKKTLKAYMANMFEKSRYLIYKAKQTTLGHNIYGFLYDVGIWDAIKDMLCFWIVKKQMRYPTQQMIVSQKFFGENADRVQKIVSLLSDQNSRKIFLNMIDFRCNRNLNFSDIGDTREQYFPTDLFSYGLEENFIDCGAYDGDTIRLFKMFLQNNNGGYKNIVAFEPNLELCNRLKHEHEDVKAFNKGVWSENTILTFSNERMLQHNETAFSSDTVEIPVISIDACKECENATFIKMDIEGAELNALKGAAKTITRLKPKLAICIYHSDEDMLTIAEWLHETVPEYKLYVRQHRKYSESDTVLYATV